MNKQTELSVQELKNLSADFTVSPPIPREALLAKDASGKYHVVRVDTDGKLEVTT